MQINGGGVEFDWIMFGSEQAAGGVKIEGASFSFEEKKCQTKRWNQTGKWAKESTHLNDSRAQSIESDRAGVRVWRESLF